MSRSGERQTYYMIKEAFGTQVKLFRNKSGMTQEELAQQSGLAIRFVQDIEAGNKLASLKTVFKLADGLGVSPNELVKASYQDWQKAGKPD